MNNQLYVSTGAFIGRANGRSPEGFLSLWRTFPCDGFEFMMYNGWYDELDRILSRFRSSGALFPTFHCDKLIGEGFSDGRCEGREHALALFRENCRAASVLGSRLLVLHLWNGAPSDFHIGRHIEALADLYTIAREYGLLLTVENVVCANLDPMTHFDAILASYPDAVFTFDTKMAAFHGQMDEIVSPARRPLWDRIVHVHLNDYGGGYRDFSGLRVLHLGEGKIDFPPFVSCLRAVGYSGAVTLECTCMNPDGTLTPDKMNESIRIARTYLSGTPL